MTLTTAYDVFWYQSNPSATQLTFTCAATFFYRSSPANRSSHSWFHRSTYISHRL